MTTMTKLEAAIALLGAGASATADERFRLACLLGAKALSRAALHKARNRKSRKARGKSDWEPKINWLAGLEDGEGRKEQGDGL